MGSSTHVVCTYSGTGATGPFDELRDPGDGDGSVRTLAGGVARQRRLIRGLDHSVALGAGHNPAGGNCLKNLVGQVGVIEVLADTRVEVRQVVVIGDAARPHACGKAVGDLLR